MIKCANIVFSFTDHFIRCLDFCSGCICTSQRMRTGRCHVHRCNDAAQCNDAADCVLIVRITHHHLDRWWIDANKIASHDPISSRCDGIVSYDTSQRFTMHGACLREYEISRSSSIGNSYYNDSKRNQSSG